MTEILRYIRNQVKESTLCQPVPVSYTVRHPLPFSLHFSLKFQSLLRARPHNHCMTVDTHSHPETLYCKTESVDTVCGRFSLRFSGPYRYTVTPYFKSSLSLYLLSFSSIPLVLLSSCSPALLPSYFRNPSFGSCPYSDTTIVDSMEGEAGIPRGREGLLSDFTGPTGCTASPLSPSHQFWASAFCIH